MNDAILEFVSQQKIKSRFYGASPYVIIDGYEVPVLLTDTQLSYSEGLSNNFFNIILHVDKFTVEEQYYNLVVHSKSTGQMALLVDCMVETLRFSKIAKSAFTLFVSFRTHKIIVADIKYKIGSALYIFEHIFTATKAPMKDFYGNDYRICDGKHFINAFNDIKCSETKSAQNYKVELRNLGVCKIPLYLFDNNPTIVIEPEQLRSTMSPVHDGVAESYYRITDGISLTEFEIKLLKGIKPENARNTVTGTVLKIAQISEHDLRIMFIDSVLKEI